MGFNSGFKGLIQSTTVHVITLRLSSLYRCCASLCNVQVFLYRGRL